MSAMTLETALREQNVPFRRSRHRSCFTSPELAAAVHVSGYNVAKPVIVKTPAGFAMCVLTACDQLDLSKVADVLEAHTVRLATENEMRRLFPDCEIGAEPPIGAIFGLRTIVDERLHYDDEIVMQAGTHRDAIEMRREDWERVCRPIVAKIARKRVVGVD
ncbi:MAG: YbaK/EbsC family protein [Phycisphaerales bacterium]|nr:YbaK/EbsC family protein [Phycisphaerales bacterium]